MSIRRAGCVRLCRPPALYLLHYAGPRYVVSVGKLARKPVPSHVMRGHYADGTADLISSAAHPVMPAIEIAQAHFRTDLNSFTERMR